MVKPRLLVATRSAGKQPEIRAILSQLPYEIVFPDDVGLFERAEEGSLEEAGTFEGNARLKAQYFAERSRLPTAADDSGLEVLSLQGLPGVKSKRFAMPARDQDAANNAELVGRLAGAAPERRRARYRCSVVFLANSAALPVMFEGSCSGVILEDLRGTHGFGYDPLFLSDDLGKSFGEAEPAEKDAVSHRGRAFRAFAEWLEAHPL